MLLFGFAFCVAAVWFSCFLPEEKGQKLSEAAGRGDIPEMKRLIASGADVNFEFDGPGTGGSPLTSAVFMNQLDAARFLLQHGARELGGDSDCGSLLQVARTGEMKQLLVNTICRRAAGTPYAR